MAMFEGKMVDFQTHRGVSKVGLKHQREIAESEYIFVNFLK